MSGTGCWSACPIVKTGGPDRTVGRPKHESKDGQRLGLTGFGASAHLVLKMVRHQFPGVWVSVFARSLEEQAFARSLGAVWAGDTKETAPHPLDRIPIIPEVETFSLESANRALMELKNRRIRGAKVLVMDHR